MKNKVFWGALAILLVSLPLAGQSNQTIDAFLAQGSADTATTLLLLGQSLGALSGEADGREAMAWAAEQPWARKVRSFGAGDFLPLGNFAAVLMESYGLRGNSVMYGLFKTPRYAARAAFNKGLFAGWPYHTRRMAPAEVLLALSLAMEVQNE